MRCLTVLIFAGLAACGSHAAKGPGAADIGSALRAQILTHGTSRFASIEHVQVRSIAPATDAAYLGSVRYEMVFNKGWSDIARDLEAAPKPASAEEAQSRQKLIYGLMALKLQYGSFSAGLRVARDANVKLRRNGSSWDLTLLPGAAGAQLAAGQPAQMPRAR